MRPDLIEELVAAVQRHYKDWTGFDDPQYLEEERNYKVAASRLAKELLGREALGELLETRADGEILDRVVRVAQATNLLHLRHPSTGDLAVVQSGELKHDARSRIVYDLLHGTGGTGERLDRYREAVQAAGLRASWPLPTYLLFLMEPESEVFVKPSVAQWLRKRAELPYRSGVNAETYGSLVALHRQLGEDLSSRELAPRDMIDVQSFLWVAYNVEKQPSSEGTDDTEGTNASEDPEVRVPIHQDHPAVEDALGRGPFAEILAERIRQTRDATTAFDRSSFAVHLYGPWGAGKSSILNFLADELRRSDPGWVVVEFNAWRQQRIRPPWWPLIREVYEQAIVQIPRNDRGRARRVWWGWRIRTSWLPVALTAATIGFVVAFLALVKSGEGPPALDLKEAVTLLLAIVSLGATLRAASQSLLLGSAKAAQAYLDLRSDPLGPLSRLFESLTRSLGRPLAIFVDDLDRCDADYVVELLEGIQTLFRRASAVYVVAADREWIRTSFERRYAGFVANVGEPGRPLGHLFLEKLFQISVAVPRLGSSARREYWQSLIALGIDRPTKEMRESIVRRGDDLLGEASTPDQIQKVVENNRGKPDEAGVRIAAAQRLSRPEIVGETEHFLAPYANLLEPNPRSMKRLVNAFGLQYASNLISGLDVPLDSLARWTILEQRWPRLAELLCAYPDLADAFADESPGDERIPEPLRSLFTRAAIHQVLGGDGDATRLDREALSRLVGEPSALGVTPPSPKGLLPH